MRTAAIVLFAAGAALLLYGFVDSASFNWQPVTAVYPGKGITLRSSFWVLEGGNFDLTVTVPALPSERRGLYRDQPPVDCDLQVVVRGRDPLFRRVTELTNSWSDPTHNGYTASGSIFFAHGGSHTIQITGNGDVPTLFRRPGTTISIDRLGGGVCWLARRRGEEGSGR